MHRPLQPYTPTLHPSTLTSTLPRPGLARRVVAPGNGSLALQGPAQLGLVLQRGFRVFFVIFKKVFERQTQKQDLIMRMCICMFIYIYICVCVCVKIYTGHVNTYVYMYVTYLHLHAFSGIRSLRACTSSWQYARG